MVDGERQTADGILRGILIIATIGLLVGRGWQHLVDSVPVRAFFWNEPLFSPVLEKLTNLRWTDYVTNLQYDHWISYLTYGFGIFYLLLTIAVIYYWLKKASAPKAFADFNSLFTKVLKISFFLAAIFLFILAFCYYLDSNYLLGQWGEYALQWMTPLFLSWFLFKKMPLPQLAVMMKIALAMTFICHGLYAIGYYPVPGSYQSMLMEIFPLTEIQAQSILKVAGLLDFIISILIFLPHRKIVIIALIYAVVWGFLTSLARPIAHFYPQFWSESLLQWTPEFLFRISHFLIPAWLLLFYKSKRGI